MYSVKAMSSTVDCPICMDYIESTTKNCVTTECGHCFHTNCLMQSVVHNGFGCPCCRSIMAEKPDEDEDSVWEDEDEEYDEDEDEDAMRGFRFLWNNVTDETHDPDDEAAEDDYEAEQRASANETQDPSVPSINFVAQKLREQGVTFEQLVQTICSNEHEEYEDDESGERIADELFGKIRIIVSNYTPEQAPEQSPNAAHPVPVPVVETDFTSQPKTQVRQVRNDCLIQD